MKVKITALFVAALFVFSVAVHAQDINGNTELTETELDLIDQAFSDPGALPGDFWYGFKRFGEGLQDFFTFDKLEKAKLHLNLAKLRLVEAKVMKEKNKLEDVRSLIEEYNTELNKTVQNTPLGQSISDVVKQANMTLPKGEIILELLYARATESEKHDLEIAIDNTIQKQILLQEKLQAKIDETAEDFEKRFNCTGLHGLYENQTNMSANCTKYMGMVSHGMEMHKIRIAKVGEKKEDMIERSLERLDELIVDAQEKNQTARLMALETIGTRLDNKIDDMKKSGKFTVVIGQKQAMIKNRNMPSMPVCASSFHGVGLTYKEALDIIDSSECGQNGHATGREFCNPDNGFWWFDMGMPDENNCVASCVIDMKTKTVEADTRCLPIPEHKILPAPSVVTYEAD